MCFVGKFVHGFMIGLCIHVFMDAWALFSFVITWMHFSFMNNGNNTNFRLFISLFDRMQPLVFTCCLSSVGVWCKKKHHNPHLTYFWHLWEVPSYLKCTLGFLRGSLILEAFNVPTRKFNLWIRPLSYCLECGGGGKENQGQLLVNDCISLSPNWNDEYNLRASYVDFSFV